MMTISITKLYDLISVKLGKETAENLTNFKEEKIKKEVEIKASNLATKEDLVRVEGKITANVAGVKAELSAQASENKAELMKWMFIFWAGQLIAIFGFLHLFLKK